MELETINRLFLELSQFCTATTKRESELQSRVRELDDQLRWRKWPEEKPEGKDEYMTIIDMKETTTLAYCFGTAPSFVCVVGFGHLFVIGDQLANCRESER